MDTTAPATNGPAREKLTSSLRHMVDEADQLLRQAADTGDEKLDEARLRMERQLRELRLQLDELQDQAMVRARRAARQADHAVHNHPYGAMGVAAAVGVLIGLLAGRSR